MAELYGLADSTACTYSSYLGIMSCYKNKGKLLHLRSYCSEGDRAALKVYKNWSYCPKTTIWDENADWTGCVTSVSCYLENEVMHVNVSVE